MFLTKYFCRKYQRWLTLNEINTTHKGRCFNVRKGRRRGKPCSKLVFLPS